MNRQRRSLVQLGPGALLVLGAAVASAQSVGSAVSQGRTLTPAAAEQTENALTSNPGDLLARGRLLGYYAARAAQDPAARTARVRHVGWLVRNAPESLLLQYAAARLRAPDFAGASESLESLRAAWLGQVDRHPNDPVVLANAWQSMGNVEAGINGGERAAGLLKRLRVLEPGDPEWALELAGLYALALPRGMAPSAPADARRAADAFAADLRQSTDAAVVGLTGALVYVSARMQPNQAAVNQAGGPLLALAESLLRRASTLNPGNPAWASTIDAPAPASGAALGAMLTSLVQVSDLWPGHVARSMPVPPGGTSLSAAEEAARRPQLAVEGLPAILPAGCSVQFDALIGTDGRVKDLQVAGFERLNIPFVAAERTALRQAQYPPVLVAGRPVEAVLRIDAKCPQSAPVVGGLVSGLAPGGFAPPPPPPPPPPASTLRVAKDVAAANLITRVPPAYPPLAKSARIQGVVVLSVTIGKAGTVTSVRVVSSSNALLTQAAIDAARQWVYTPFVVNGVPQDVTTTVDVPFKLTS